MLLETLLQAQPGFFESLTSDSLTSAPITALFVLFGAGVITSVTPCVYPMIPITIGVLGGSGAENRSRGKTIRLTAVYVLGLALFYAILGLLAGLTGSLFGVVSSNPWVMFGMGNILLIFGLAMLDVFPVSAPQRLVQWVSGLGGGSYPSIFLLGATSGIVAAPCGAPAFAVVLTWVAATQSPLMGFVYLLVFSIGMTTLLVAIGLSSGFMAAMPKPGPWMNWIKKGAGVIMLGAAEYYFVKVGMGL